MLNVQHKNDIALYNYLHTTIAHFQLDLYNDKPKPSDMASQRQEASIHKRLTPKQAVKLPAHAVAIRQLALTFILVVLTLFVVLVKAVKEGDLREHLKHFFSVVLKVGHFTVEKIQALQVWQVLLVAAMKHTQSTLIKDFHCLSFS